MRIILIIDVRWFNASAGFALDQARALGVIGNRVLILANPGSPPAARAKDLGLEVSEAIDFSRTNILKSTLDLVSITRSFEPDVIFAHRGESHLVAALASKKTGCPVARFRGDVRPPRRGIFSRILNERLTRGIAVSTSRLKGEYEKRYRLNGLPLQVIYPGIDSSRFDFNLDRRTLKRSFGLDPDSPVVGIVGRFSPVKGHRYFLEAAKIVSESEPDVQFVIAGGDAQISAGELRRQAEEMSLRNIRFFGIIDEIDSMISSFDIGIVASVGSEMICRVLTEYFAAGAAVVAFGVNQVSELLSISNGGIEISPRDSENMGRSILDLCRNMERRLELSRSGRLWAERAGSLQNLGVESEKFLERVIDV